MGLLAPKGTPPAIIDRLQRALAQALAGDEVRSYMETVGIEIVGSTPTEFSTFFHAEKERWAKVIKEAAIKISE